MIQLRAGGADEGVAGEIVAHHLELVENGHNGEIASRLGRPQRHVDIALRLIRGLDPRPGQHYAASKTRTVEPDVYFVKTQDGFRVVLDQDDLPDLRLNRQYRQLLQKGRRPRKYATTSRTAITPRSNCSATSNSANTRSRGSATPSYAGRARSLRTVSSTFDR